jgi:zinc transport system permease protein
MNVFELLSKYFSYEFVWFALIVGVLVSLCSALFGVVLVLKRFSFIGDGLSHVAFGALAIATVMDITDNMLIVLPVTVVCAILLLGMGRNAKIKGDAAIAMLSAGSLAVGYLIMSLFSNSGNVAGDVCSTLFGSFAIITLSRAEVIACVVMSAIVIALFVVLYNRIFSVTFDESFASASGVRASLYNLLIAVITAVIIVLAMNLVGSLLISALVIFPALSAMRVARTFKGVVITAAIISTLCALIGILTAILASTPVGPTVVAVDILAFAVCYIVGKLVKVSK